jgi:hypothetical protein
MRGIIGLLLIVGLVVFGCTGGSPQGNQTGANSTNQTNQTPIETCEGPVCGSDGATYATDCQAELAGVSIQYAGECAAPPEPNCSDSDMGIEPSVFGTAVKGNETHDDYCLDANQLIEYSCLDNNLQTATVQCGANKTCDAGACVAAAAPPEQNQTAPPSAGCSGMVEADIYRKDSAAFNGTIFNDSCVDYKVVKDYFCAGEALQAINNQCPSGFACTDGACFRLSFNCTETDDGNDTAKRGKTTVFKGLITTFDQFDECIDEGTVKEYSCLPDGTYATSEVLCGSGLKCVGGRCTDSKCHETDGGLNIFKHGITTVDGKDYEDHCINDHDILEYYCYGDSVDTADVSCGKGYICSADMDKCIEGSVG